MATAAGWLALFFLVVGVLLAMVSAFFARKGETVLGVAAVVCVVLGTLFLIFGPLSLVR
jgi:hypothetical protein